MKLHVKLHVIEDHDSAKIWIGPEINHGDWPFRFLLKLEYCEEWDSEWAENGKYHVSVEAASPEAAGEENCKHAASSWGMTWEEFQKYSSDVQCLILSNYGVKTVLWQKQGHNRDKLLKEAREELAKIDMLFGFYMDRQVNAIGASGWDAIRGDLCRPIREPAET